MFILYKPKNISKMSLIIIDILEKCNDYKKEYGYNILEKTIYQKELYKYTPNIELLDSFTSSNIFNLFWLRFD